MYREISGGGSMDQRHHDSLVNARRKSIDALPVTIVLVALTGAAAYFTRGAWALLFFGISAFYLVGDSVNNLYTTRTLAMKGMPRTKARAGLGEASARSAFRRVWQKLMGNRTRLSELQHPVLGTVRFSQEDDSWVSVVRSGERVVRLLVDGDEEPDPRDLAHAAEIASSLEVFAGRVEQFLEAEAARSGEPAAGEIRQLKIESVVFSSRRHPGDAMVWFDGPDEFRGWRCDYHGGQLRHLGFDD
jgi:hypothetical protein